MTRLLWGRAGERTFERGLNRGVLYLSDNSGVVWNGLTAVDEDLSDDTTNPLYFDGTKYHDDQTTGDYSATLKAFAYPDQFVEYEGEVSIGQGLSTEYQMVKTFGLSYKTLIGNDLVGDDYGYKIHLVWNLTATPEGVTEQTEAGQVILTDFSWGIFAVPTTLAGYLPTAHVILDSTLLDPHLLADVERILYGTDEEEARLPSLEELSEFILNWVPDITIVDNGDGTWSAIGSEEFIIMLNPTTFQLNGVTGAYLDADTYELPVT